MPGLVEFRAGQRSGKARRQLVMQLLSASTCCMLCWHVHRYPATDLGLQECQTLGEHTMQSQLAPHCCSAIAAGCQVGQPRSPPPAAEARRQDSSASHSAACICCCFCRYGYTETIDQGPAFVEGALRTLLRQLFDALHISVQQSQALSARHPSLAIGDPPQSPTAHEAISASQPSVDAASVQPMVGNGTLAGGSPAGSASSSPAKGLAVHALQIAEGAHPA